MDPQPDPWAEWLRAVLTAAGSLAIAAVTGGAMGYRLGDYHSDVTGLIAGAAFFLTVGWLVIEWAVPNPPQCDPPPLRHGAVCGLCLFAVPLAECSGVSFHGIELTPQGVMRGVQLVSPVVLPMTYFARYRRWRGFTAVYLFAFSAALVMVWNGLGDPTIAGIFARVRY